MLWSPHSPVAVERLQMAANREDREEGRVLQRLGKIIVVASVSHLWKPSLAKIAELCADAEKRSRGKAGTKWVTVADMPLVQVHLGELW